MISCVRCSSCYHLVGLVIKTSALRTADLGFIPAIPEGILLGRVIPVTEKLVTQWLPGQTPGDIGSALGVVGLVSVYCDWVR